MPYEPINVGPGEHLGWGRGPDGGRVGLVFDAENNLVRHAVWKEVDDPADAWVFQASPTQPPPPPPRQLTEEEQAFIQAAAIFLVQVAIEMTPVVKNWWIDTVVPAIRRRRERRRRLRLERRTRKRGSLPPRSSDRASFTDAAKPVAEVIGGATVTMTREDWKRRYEAMLAAQEFSEDQRRLLSVARIVDLQGSPKEKLTPQQFTETIQLKLAANPRILEEENTAQLIRVVSKAKALEA